MSDAHAFGRLVAVWLALLALLMLTFGSAYVPLGVWNGVANLAIAAVKAVLVAIVFMHLAAGRPIYRVALMAALFTLALMLSLTLADYWFRV